MVWQNDIPRNSAIPYQEISLKVVQKSTFFAHPKNVLIAIVSDKNENVCQSAVNKVQFLRRNMFYVSFTAHCEASCSDGN